MKMAMNMDQRRCILMSGTLAFVSEYQLTSADLTALQTFTPAGLVPGNMAAWQQQQQPSLAQQQTAPPISLASLTNLV